MRDVEDEEASRDPNTALSRDVCATSSKMTDNDPGHVSARPTVNDMKRFTYLQDCGHLVKMVVFPIFS